MALAYTGGSGGGGGGGGVQSVTAGDTSIAIGGTASNPTVAVGVVPLSDLADPGSGKVVGSSGGAAAAVFPPGYEIGYDQITATVPITSSSPSAPTTIITSSSHTFDGNPVMVEFFSPQATLIATAGQTMTLLLTEDTTALARWGFEIAPGSSNMGIPISLLARLTPSAGAHTFTVSAWLSSVAGGEHVVAGSGSGGTGAVMPSFIRITKV